MDEAVLRTGRDTAGPSPNAFAALTLADLDSFFAFDVLTGSFSRIPGS